MSPGGTWITSLWEGTVPLVIQAKRIGASPLGHVQNFSTWTSVRPGNEPRRNCRGCEVNDPRVTDWRERLMTVAWWSRGGGEVARSGWCRRRSSEQREEETQGRTTVIKTKAGKGLRRGADLLESQGKMMRTQKTLSRWTRESFPVNFRGLPFKGWGSGQCGDVRHEFPIRRRWVFEYWKRSEDW